MSFKLYKGNDHYVKWLNAIDELDDTELTGATVTYAVALVSAYQDSADRAKMLATLTALRVAR